MSVYNKILHGRGLRLLGGISGKGLTLNGQPGNEGERLYETPSGVWDERFSPRPPSSPCATPFFPR